MKTCRAFANPCRFGIAAHLKDRLCAVTTIKALVGKAVVLNIVQGALRKSLCFDFPSQLKGSSCPRRSAIQKMGATAGLGCASKAFVQVH